MFCWPVAKNITALTQWRKLGFFSGGYFAESGEFNGNFAYFRGSVGQRKSRKKWEVSWQDVRYWLNVNENVIQIDADVPRGFMPSTLMTFALFAIFLNFYELLNYSWKISGMNWNEGERKPFLLLLMLRFNWICDTTSNKLTASNFNLLLLLHLH